MDRKLESLVWERAEGRCEYCQMLANDDVLPFEIDHIIAEQHQGSTSEENLCLACFACNRHKGPNVAGVDPLTGKVAPLFHPRRQHWSRHFRWQGAVLTGRTASGRATVVTLAINLDYRVDLRQSLIDEGVFPHR
ncbi:HNH endonuclease [Paludisphaera rhizosphaerae]|uniref:HNH endonuclease n=1 Tax=Paludisphaera rhizosphaerae TaxID=2711216 RepID=UPI0013E9C980|nr:HNH endonuclease signature motif containing protein [Paludisphaera rhizosphaerae]